MLGVPIFCGWLTSCLANSYNATYLATEKRKGRDNYSHGASAGLQQFGGPKNMGRFLKMTSHFWEFFSQNQPTPHLQPTTFQQIKSVEKTLAVSCHGNRGRKLPGCEKIGASSPAELASFSSNHIRRRGKARPGKVVRPSLKRSLAALLTDSHKSCRFKSWMYRLG